jgi:hypothetical protein
VDWVARGYGLVRGRTGTERRKPGTAGEPVYSDQWVKGRLTLIPRRHRQLARYGRRGVARLSHLNHPRTHPYLVIGVTGLRLPRRSLGYLRVPYSRTVLPADDEVDHPGRGRRPAPSISSSGYPKVSRGCLGAAVLTQEDLGVSTERGTAGSGRNLRADR